MLLSIVKVLVRVFVRGMIAAEAPGTKKDSCARRAGRAVALCCGRG